MHLYWTTDGRSRDHNNGEGPPTLLYARAQMCACAHDTIYVRDDALYIGTDVVAPYFPV